MDYFSFHKVAYSDSVMEEIYRLRFRVYCLECGYEDPCDYIHRKETDEYDGHSTHFCALEKSSSDIVGTARIIHPSHLGLPIFNYFDLDSEVALGVDPTKVGEISRLAISKEYRRRMVDRAIFEGSNVIDFMGQKEKRDWRKRFEVTLVSGLYHSIYEESLNLGLTHLFAIMSKGLHCLLEKWGLVLHAIGPEQDHHGLRMPYMASMEENMGWFEEEARKRGVG